MDLRLFCVSHGYIYRRVNASGFEIVATCVEESSRVGRLIMRVRGQVMIPECTGL
jgi:hypothetical protein